MTVRWRTVIPCSIGLVTFFLTCKIFTQLPANDADYDSDADLAQEQDQTGKRAEQGEWRHEQALKQLHNNEEDKRNRRRRMPTGSRDRERAFRLFDDDEPEAGDKLPRVKQQEQAVDGDQQNLHAAAQQAQQKDEAGEAAQRNGDDTAQNNEEQGQRNAHEVDPQRQDEDIVRSEQNKTIDHVAADEDDDNNRQLAADNAQPAAANVDETKLDGEVPPEDRLQAHRAGNNSLLLENVRAVGEIVQRLKQQHRPGNVDRHAENRDELEQRRLTGVNPHPFRYLINCPQLCAGLDDLFMIIYVHTAIDHYKRRAVIRQTWGDGSQYGINMRVLFVMGIQLNEPGKEDGGGDDASTALMFEAERYGDIVQEDFVDTYHNLTYKGVAALRWIDTYCSQALFVLKTDDDIFVNMFSLLRYLKRLTRDTVRPQGLLMCCVWNGMPVQRTGKWKVTKEEWPDDSYPTYCSGSAFFMSTDVAVRMHSVSYDVPFFWVDDFYISGLLPLKLGNVTHRQFASAYVLNGDLLEEMFTGSQWYLYVFSEVHNLDRIQAVWDTVVQLATGRRRPRIAMRTVQAQVT